MIPSPVSFPGYGGTRINVGAEVLVTEVADCGGGRSLFVRVLRVLGGEWAECEVTSAKKSPAGWKPGDRLNLHVGCLQGAKPLTTEAA